MKHQPFKVILQPSMKDLVFTDSLHFSCIRCSSCCRHEGGYVYLSENDLKLLENMLKMPLAALINTWCRWIPYVNFTERLALKEKSNYDCIFWGANEGCTVYNARPLQCRTFPFWDHVVCSEDAWKKAALYCPGINNGELHPKEQIEELLRQIDDEPVVERATPRIGA